MTLIDATKQLCVNERCKMNSKTNSRLLLLHLDTINIHLDSILDTTVRQDIESSTPNVTAAIS